MLTGKASDFLKIGVAAAGRGDLDTLQAVLAEKPHWLRRIGSHGRTMLWEAAYRGRLEMVEYLADLGADIDACGCHFTPLLVDISPYCAALHKKHRDVAAFLLDRGAALDIHTAAYLGDIEAVQEYLDRDPNSCGGREEPERHERGRPPPCTTLSLRDMPISSPLLLESGADPRPYGYFLVRFCIWRDRVDILETLIAAGLDPSMSEPPRSGIANPAMAEVLKAHGVDYGPDHAEGGWPPIVFQSRGDRGGNVERVRKLIEAGADVNVRNHKGQSALHCAAKAGFVDIVALLLEHGCEADARDRQGETPLAAALRSTVKDKAKLLDVVRLIVNAGADADLADHNGRSPRAIAGAKRNARLWVDALDGD